MNIAPHRFLANNNNVVRTALLSAGAIEPALNSVIADDSVPRDGNAQATLAGAYTGTEEATYEIQITGNIIDHNLISTPMFVGSGSGEIRNVAAAGTPQTYTVELFDPGVEELRASVDFEGVKLISRSVPGNGLSLVIDQTGLEFEDTIYSLLVDLEAGAGGQLSGLEGLGFDWDTKVMASDNILPEDAHRIVFGDDETVVYLAYKRYVAADAKWLYHFIPEIKRRVPKGTAIRFVSGGRTVTVYEDGIPTGEVFADIVTVYDFLHALRTESSLLDVEGVVSNDRGPTGQAAREFLLRTDAHAEPATGNGRYAHSLESITVAENALTELVTITCYGVSDRDTPTAYLGSELWTVAGSLSGTVGTARTNEPFLHPDRRWGFTIPRKLPDGYGIAKGRFTANPPTYAPRGEDVTPPPICVTGMTLGPNAVDGLITLKWTKRPSGDCDCTEMASPKISMACLGIFSIGGSAMDYSEDNRARLALLYGWEGAVVRARSAYLASGVAFQSPFISQPSGPPLFSGLGTYVPTFFTKTLFEMVAEWERTLALIDALPSGSPEGQLRAEAEAIWDLHVAEFKSDVTGGTAQYEEFPVWEDMLAGEAAGTFVDNDGVQKIRKAVPGLLRYGFVAEDLSAGSPEQRIYYFGTATVAGATFTVGAQYGPSSLVPGEWTNVPEDMISNIYAMYSVLPYGRAANATTLTITNSYLYNYNNVYYALLADRYRARMQEVLITGGISPLGKANASTIESGDGCWRDYGDPFYWSVSGPIFGYGHAFINKPYVSVRKADDESKYYSTKEFAFQVNVAESCVALLKEGDEITMPIGDAGWPPTYNVGDQIVLPVVAAAPFTLAGGRIGTTTQRWYVNRSADSPLPIFNFVPGDSPSLYDEGGFSFEMVKGGIPFAKGDRFQVDVEGGSWRWRKTIGETVGAWSTEAAITQDAEELDEGLELTFTTGRPQSFVAGDLFRFRALQPRAVSNVRAPTGKRWQWVGADVPLVVDCGSIVDVSMLAIALHRLPAGSTVTVEGGTLPGIYTWEEELTVIPGAIVAELSATVSVRYLRFTFSAAGGVGWVWAGVPFTTELGVAVQLRNQYKIDRSEAGLFGGGVSAGSAIGGTVVWTEGSIKDNVEAAALAAMYHWSKTNHDEPFLFVPNITVPEEVLLARVVDDELPIEDFYEYGLHAQKNKVGGRRFAATLELSGVWQ